jgi:hypothetical protein
MGEPTELHLERVQPTVRRLRVRIAEGPDRDRVVEHYGERVGVGTSPANELTLTDPTVSHYHLELRCEDGVVVKDLGSRNGTFVGDLRVNEAVVPIGTRVRIGRTVLVLLDATIAPPETPLPPPDVPGLVTASPRMQEIGRTVERLAQSNVSVLIQGETGTGKELVARAMHDLSARAKRPFIVVDPGALPATLIASQLFGHERGAFTGAEKRQEGAFELAHGGSIFLDEIGELPLAVQPACSACSSAVRSGAGRKEDIQVDVRVISPRTATCAPRRTRARSAPICTFVWPSRASRSRRCATGPRTSIRWWRTSPPRSPARPVSVLGRDDERAARPPLVGQRARAA